jgi:hypothetical protein
MRKWEATLPQAISVQVKRCRPCDAGVEHPVHIGFVQGVDRAGHVPVPSRLRGAHAGTRPRLFNSGTLGCIGGFLRHDDAPAATAEPAALGAENCQLLWTQPEDVLARTGQSIAMESIQGRSPMKTDYERTCSSSHPFSRVESVTALMPPTVAPGRAKQRTPKTTPPWDGSSHCSIVARWSRHCPCHPEHPCSSGDARGRHPASWPRVPTWPRRDSRPPC